MGWNVHWNLGDNFRKSSPNENLIHSLHVTYIWTNRITTISACFRKPNISTFHVWASRCNSEKDNIWFEWITINMYYTVFVGIISVVSMPCHFIDLVSWRWSVDHDAKLFRYDPHKGESHEDTLLHKEAILKRTIQPRFEDLEPDLRTIRASDYSYVTSDRTFLFSYSVCN